MEPKQTIENREVLPSQKSGNHRGRPFPGNRKLMQGQEVISDFQLYNESFIKFPFSIFERIIQIGYKRGEIKIFFFKRLSLTP